MFIEWLLALLIATFALVYSTPVNQPETNDRCLFKDGDRFPTFMHYVNGKTIELLCSNDTCLCDGTNTGYKGCQSCCCTIRERIQACAIVDNSEVKSVGKEERGNPTLVWAIVATIAFVLVILIAVKAYYYQKRQADEYRQKITNLTGSLKSLNIGGATELNQLPNDANENNAVVQVPETVFPLVKTVQREENNNHESQMQSSSNEIENIQSSSNDHVENTIDNNATQEVNHDVADEEAASISSSQ